MSGVIAFLKAHKEKVGLAFAGILLAALMKGFFFAQGGLVLTSLKLVAAALIGYNWKGLMVKAADAKAKLGL